MSRIAILHGAGYIGRELIRLLLPHPLATLTCVTSRTYAGKSLDVAHPMLRGQHRLKFADPEAFNPAESDAVLIAAEHRKGAATVVKLLESGYQKPVIDLSADHRFSDVRRYEALFETTHPAPASVELFQYGVPEIFAPYLSSHIANPGCFATGMLLSLWPLHINLGAFTASVTAMTGASGSGTRPKVTTHFPSRDGNVRAYKVLTHQHLPEITQFLHPDTKVHFVPVSGPWTRGIWGTVQTSAKVGESEVTRWFEKAYGEHRFVRLWPGSLPELHYSVGSPFCDLGWVVQNGHVVIGFALDNMLKGAASQAIQNLNLLLDWPEASGLLTVE